MSVTAAPACVTATIAFTLDDPTAVDHSDYALTKFRPTEGTITWVLADDGVGWRFNRMTVSGPRLRADGRDGRATSERTHRAERRSFPADWFDAVRDACPPPALATVDSFRD
jgi:hypothetical protein